MQFSLALIAFVAGVMATPVPNPVADPAPQATAPIQTATSGTVIDNQDLVPGFGVTAGQDPNGSGSCVGNGGVLIPCNCPPDFNDFIQRMQQFVNAGSALGDPISFPTDNSTASQIARLNACIVTLQNFDGVTPGQGCPASSTTYVAQRTALGG